MFDGSGRGHGAGDPRDELVAFEDSAHMPFVEENIRYVSVVREFLERHL